MITRPYRPADRPALELLAAATGFPYPQPNSPLIEVLLVVEDDEGRIVMACAAERIMQLYLWPAAWVHPAAKLHALRLLHCEMASTLKKKGYTEANAFLPEIIARKFGRRLERTFGWVVNWRSWAIHF